MTANFKQLFLLCILLCSLCFLSCTREQPTLEPLNKQAIILAFGDSLTYGTGAHYKNSYPSVLAQLTGLTVIRSGIPGETSDQGLKRLNAELNQYQADLLILCHGGNDFLQKRNIQQTKKNLLKMVQLAKKRGIQVLLIGVPKPAISLSSAELYYEVAEETNIPLEFEVLSDILSKPSLKSDRVHPNKEGYRAMATAIYQLLIDTKAL